MLSWAALSDDYNAVLAGMAAPWLIAIVLALTTLLLEDLAIAAGVALATQGAIGWTLSMAAVGGGIAAGDVGLYGLGLAAPGCLGCTAAMSVSEAFGPNRNSCSACPALCCWRG